MGDALVARRRRCGGSLSRCDSSVVTKNSYLVEGKFYTLLVFLFGHVQGDFAL